MIKPFADNEATASIGDLNIENGTEKIAISGSVEITRDQVGLALAHGLKNLVDGLIAELEKGDLPPHVAAGKPASVDQIDNPFA